MDQIRQRWSTDGEAAWLSMLVKTLEQLSDQDERAAPCDSGDVSAAKAHLAHPAYFDGLYGSDLSLRN